MKKLICLILAAFAANAFAQLPAIYQTLEAPQKLQILWSQVSSKPYSELPDMTLFPADSYKLAHGYRLGRDAASLGKAFDHVSDEMPEGRIKVIHAYGSVAAVEFVSSGEHPFSGLFKSGALGIVRLSLGTPLATSGSFVPGMGIKFLVNGQPSKNMHVMQRLEGQGDNHNIFMFPFTNKLPEPTSTATQVGAKYFGRFVQNPIFLRVNHVASVSSDGTPVAEVKAPYQIFFQPALGLAINPKAADFRTELAKLPAGTKLYDVYGTPNEYVKTPVYIGYVFLRSGFVASEYGDKKLYFQHEGSARRSFWLGRNLSPASAPSVCPNCPSVE